MCIRDSADSGPKGLKTGVPLLEPRWPKKGPKVGYFFDADFPRICRQISTQFWAPKVGFWAYPEQALERPGRAYKGIWALDRAQNRPKIGLFGPISGLQAQGPDIGK